VAVEERAKQEPFLQANGKLSFDAPQDASRAAYDEYPSDPAKPVPF
jgi:predicted acyl esterase